MTDKIYITKNNYSGGPSGSSNEPFLYYPTDLNFFPNVFLKLEFFDRVKVSAIPITTIYLPLPETDSFIAKDLLMQYGFDELGIPGEFAKRNSTEILDSIAGDFSKDVANESTGSETQERLDKILGLITTYTERFLLKADRPTGVRRIASQGLGYSYAPHKTQMFKDMNFAKEKTLEFNFTPKNIKDARMIEKISKKIVMASLPELQNEFIKNNVVNFAKKLNVTEVLEEIPFAENAPIGNQGLLSPRPYLIDKGAPLVDVISKYLSDKTDGAIPEFSSTDVLDALSNSNPQQYFSQAFSLPYAVRLKIMKKDNFGQNVESAREAKELFVFPKTFLISDYVVDTVQQKNQNEAKVFIEYINEFGETEYYNQSHYISLTLVEEQVQTSEDQVDYSDNIIKNNLN